MNTEAHWETIYKTKTPEEVSWYRPHLETSLNLVERVAGSRDASIIDVGGGEATLVDDLLALGFRNITVLDISQTALDVTRKRLGTLGEPVRWLASEVTTAPLAPSSIDVWHDRAVFHFLTAEEARAAYVNKVLNCMRRGGHVIVSTFGPDGPTRCSGLDVVRYDADALHHEFGQAFQLVESSKELHHTPWGAVQQFVYCHCRVT